MGVGSRMHSPTVSQNVIKTCVLRSTPASRVFLKTMASAASLQDTIFIIMLQSRAPDVRQVGIW